MLSEVGIAYFNNSWNFLCLESQAEADWERKKKIEIINKASSKEIR